MKQKKKTFTAGMNVGSSSILVTFVLLCLITFAALSFVAANTDHNLTEQTANRISSYYVADSQAEVHLANIDNQLSSLATDVDEKAYFDGIEQLFSDNDSYTVSKEGNKTFISYEVMLSNDQTINVKLEAVYPNAASPDTFKINTWETVTNYVPEPETLEEETGGFLF